MATTLRQTGLVDPRVTTVQASIDMATRKHKSIGQEKGFVNIFWEDT